MIYLPDSDTVNYLVKGRDDVLAQYQNAILGGAGFRLSAVVHYQITRYLKLKGASRVLSAYDHLVEQWVPVALQPEDWDLAADLWATRHLAGSPIEDGDLLIAVTALKAGATLVTNNARHFNGLGLTLVTWTG